MIYHRRGWAAKSAVPEQLFKDHHEEEKQDKDYHEEEHAKDHHEEEKHDKDNVITSDYQDQEN